MYGTVMGPEPWRQGHVVRSDSGGGGVGNVDPKLRVYGCKSDHRLVTVGLGD